MANFNYSKKLILATEINDKIIDSSTTIDESTKKALKNLAKSTREFLESSPLFNTYQLKSLTSEFLTYWNETIKPDTEMFWTALKTNDIDFKRKEPLKFALEKKRFRRVEQGIDARNFWSELKKLATIQKRYSNSEIEQIERIIIEDENIRLKILEKYLSKKEIPISNYLKFGECMAYFANCKLFDKYFRQGEVEELYSIWKKT